MFVQTHNLHDFFPLIKSSFLDRILFWQSSCASACVYTTLVKKSQRRTEKKLKKLNVFWQTYKFIFEYLWQKAFSLASYGAFQPHPTFFSKWKLLRWTLVKLMSFGLHRQPSLQTWTRCNCRRRSWKMLQERFCVYVVFTGLDKNGIFLPDYRRYFCFRLVSYNST